ncbi:MAG: PepSY-associated TM helix domain-containing protein [Pseudomonadales bacterium]|nr:PepSY-associated TM helix domain-containing protein [Pseudomonadales bacterium]
MKRIKRYLLLVHRWFGVAMCLLLMLWFASGIIMMYVEYPELTEAERIALLPALVTDRIKLDPVEAAARAQTRNGKPLAALRLSSVLGRPAYQVRDQGGTLTTVFADNGEILKGLNAQQAAAAVLHSGYAMAAAVPIHAQKIDMDQWTISSALDGDRPLYRVQVGDADGTVLYVSSRSGQIVRDTNRHERFWNWLGSTIHWIYPLQLRRHAGLWTEVIIYLALAGLVSVVTGGIIGFMRIRLKKRHQGQPLSPYRGIDKWHHLLGLGCLVFVFTFLFSGLMSMGPWGIFAGESSAAEQIKRYTGGNPGNLRNFPPLNLQALGTVKEVSWEQLGGQGHLVLTRAAKLRQVVFDGTGMAAPAAILRDRITRAIPALLPMATVTARDVLTEYDDYYYSRHQRYRPLPVMRATFDDAEATGYYIDLATGIVVSRFTTATRMERWLYNGLHSLDFPFLLARRPLWDVLVILLCLVGLGFSVTSVIMGWRRLSLSRSR